VKNNLINVAAAVLVIATGLSLGMIWGARPYSWLSELQYLAVTARPAATALALLACGVALYARTLRNAVPLLVAAGVTQLVVSITYAVALWVPAVFFQRPVG
jgi:hypothetical protein